MNQIHRLAAMRFLPVYCYATGPLRRLGLRFARAVGMCPITVVYYHRVSDRSVNPWTISHHDFRGQIEWLAAHVELISLSEAQRRLASGFNGTPAVCITFDDGYAENGEHALPLLIERNIPVTYFVATQYILNNQSFPHDVARGEPLSPNSAAQLRSYAELGIEIGAHTRTHADLGSLQNRESLWYEIAGSRDDLQQLLGQEVRYFAFPFGQYQNLGSVAVKMIRKAGFSGFCSAYGGYNFPRSDAFHLQRIHADPHWPRFQNWMSFDPRIALGVRRWNETSDVAASECCPDGTYLGASQVSGAETTFPRATAVDGNDR